MDTTKAMNQALKEAKKKYLYKPHSDVVNVTIGLKKVGGKIIGEAAILFGVRKKLSRSEIPQERMLPRHVKGEQTDVEEYDELTAPPKLLAATTQELTQFQRPFPPGGSVGHPNITAGSLGAWLRSGEDGLYRGLSNNHIFAACNAATINDIVLQPGKADGGFSGNSKYHLGRLENFVVINFESKKKTGAAALYWRGSKWIPNKLAQMAGCPVRLKPHFEFAQGIEQPIPNLVDAAIIKPMEQSFVSLDVPYIGPFQGLGVAELGDEVINVSRTTGYSEHGLVTGIQSAVRVNFGSSGNAVFDQQFNIESTDGKDFSAGGDSGSVIVLKESKRICGLLFAGGSGVTIANRIDHVVRLLNLTF